MTARIILQNNESNRNDNDIQDEKYFSGDDNDDVNCQWTNKDDKKK
jgi:hypothetical protein